MNGPSNTFLYLLIVPIVVAGGFLVKNYLSSPSFSGAVTVNDVVLLEETYFRSNGKYLQVIGNGLLVDGSSVTTKLGTPIDAKYKVDVYKSPSGDGYIVRWQDSQGLHAVGFGAEATSSTIFTPALVATSS